MADPRTQTSENSSRNVIISLLLPGLLIGQFLWNLLTPAHEYAMRSEQFMTMTLDFLLLDGLFGLRRSMPPQLFRTALVAGIGLFALRMTSDAAWWTGHLVYSIPPR